ncbi:hypothetical protein [Clostridium polynesiense]|uniref:hypothetical protein n=1 Tax=Clostridium polynesiense TaxID=1325933 RepID=UPI00058FBE30|nr:hypothetical protein [Clostridium polynesiense]
MKSIGILKRKLKGKVNIFLSLVFGLASWGTFRFFSDLNTITIIGGNSIAVKILGIEILKSIPSESVYLYKAVFFVLSFISICIVIYNVYRFVKTNLDNEK